MALIDTRFRDIAVAEEKAYAALLNRKSQFDEIKEKKHALNRALNEAEQKEYDLIEEILGEIKKCSGKSTPEVCNPSFVAARELFTSGDGLLSDRLLSHKNGVLVFNGSSDDDVVVSASLVIGLLMADGAAPPPVIVVPPAKPASTKSAGASSSAAAAPLRLAIRPDKDHPAWKPFTKAFFSAVGEARSLEDLAKLVLPLLSIEGDPDGPEGDIQPNVDAAEFARVLRQLSAKNITSREPQLRRRVNEALDKVQSVGEYGPVEEKGIDLPDLENYTNHNIVADNVRLMGPMIVSVMFDELKAFDVVEHIVSQYQRGTLTIGQGDAGKQLYRYWREAPNRISEMERKTFQSVTLGVPGGENVEFTNREFNDLWLRFVSSVSEFVRQGSLDNLLRAGIPSPVSHQQCRKAARDLVTNLSLYGYGMAYYAAVELQEQIKDIIKLLSDQEIRAAYGAKDMWQVVDQVATLELGGAKTSSRCRALATSGAIITAWLANNVNRIVQTTGSFLNVDEIQNPPFMGSGHSPTKDPNDSELYNACESWLSYMAKSDAEVERLSQPSEAPPMTSRPIAVPSVVQDMLDGIGDMGVGFGQRQ